MAKSGCFYTSEYTGLAAKYPDRLKISWERTDYSIEKCESYIKWSAEGYGGSNNLSFTYFHGGTFTIDGKATTIPSTSVQLYNGTVVASGTATIKHDVDGKKDFTISAEVGIYTYATSSKGSQTFTLDTIPQKATTSKVTNFNDEGNPTVTFSNPGGFNLAPYINIYSSRSGTREIIHSIKRTKGKYTSPYTFSLTDAERTALRKACYDDDEYEVWIGVDTYNGDTLLDWHSLQAKLTIVNATPTFDASLISFEDTNSTVTSVTGNNQTIVQNKSTLSVTCGSATAYKGATISKYEVTLNGVTKNITTASEIINVSGFPLLIILSMP